MFALAPKFWNDEVGSSVSSEMALVTGVTIGALIMSMSNFSETVNREFQQTANSAGLTMDDLEKKKQAEKEKRAKEKATAEAELEEKRQWFLNQKAK